LVSARRRAYIHIHIACDVQPRSIYATDVTRHGRSPWLQLEKYIPISPVPITCTRPNTLVSLISDIVRARSDPSVHSETLKDSTPCNITLLLYRRLGTLESPYQRLLSTATCPVNIASTIPHLSHKLLLSPRPNGRLPYLPYFVAHVVVKLITQFLVIVH
jgi:hypothetical protein